MSRRLAAILNALGLSACMIGPDYKRPDTTIPSGWRMIGGDAAAVIKEQWWNLFNDPQLDRLIEVALAENMDIKIAIARVEEARALVVVSRAALFPQVDASASAGRARTSTRTTPVLPGVSPTNNFFLLCWTPRSSWIYGEGYGARRKRRERCFCLPNMPNKWFGWR